MQDLLSFLGPWLVKRHCDFIVEQPDEGGILQGCPAYQDDEVSLDPNLVSKSRKIFIHAQNLCCHDAHVQRDENGGDEAELDVGVAEGEKVGN